MISIRSKLTELERCHQLQEAALNCYLNAIRNVEHYALELDQDQTAQFRHHLSALADSLAGGGWDRVDDSQTTFRALLRDYRDRCSRYVAALRDELARTARALEETLDSLNQSEGDHESTVRGAVVKLRRALLADPQSMAGIVNAAANSIENTMEEMRKQHQLILSQFMAEIRVLHKRIDTLEKAASVDELTRLSSRAEMTERIKLGATGGYCLLLIGVRGLVRGEVLYGKTVGEELVAAFAKRLRNSIPRDACASRWSTEDFVVMVKLGKSEASTLAKGISQTLGGTYSCLSEGKAVRPVVEVSIAVLETSAEETPARILQRIDRVLLVPA